MSTFNCLPCKVRIGAMLVYSSGLLSDNIFRRIMRKPVFDGFIGVGSFSRLGGGCKPSAANFNTWGWGIAKSTYTHACTCTCMHTHVLNILTPMHACMHTHVYMHAQPMQTYILHPDMKIITIKASYLYEKKRQQIYKWTRKVLVIYIIYTNALLKSKQWRSHI